MFLLYWSDREKGSKFETSNWILLMEQYWTTPNASSAHTGYIQLECQNPFQFSGDTVKMMDRRIFHFYTGGCTHVTTGVTFAVRYD